MSTQIFNKITLVMILSLCLFSCNPESKQKVVLDETEESEHGHMIGNNVFNAFPDHQEDYQEDIKPHIQAIVEKHGQDEFKMGVITCELHGHVGIYAIIGMKMGLYAREMLNADIDELRIISYAGSKPPISCMNDGLQVSTGATLGHGLIEVSNEEDKRPEALFHKDEDSIQIRLSDEYWETARKDIKDAIEKNGGLTEGYWLDIRKLAIDYWLNWNRNEIFTINNNPITPKPYNLITS